MFIKHNNIQYEYYEMEVDPDEVKRHLEILGYTNIEPSLFHAFVDGKYLP